MKFYEVTFEDKYYDEREIKYYASRENAEKALKAYDEPWTNDYGVTFHTAWLRELKTED
jgi:hypothetical protein